jgi:hypothetical protein
MKPFLILLIFTGSSLVAYAQTHEEIISRRATEFHRVLTVKDKDQWRKFMKENYTKALLERPVRAKIAHEGGGNATPAGNENPDPIESKLVMFERLNADFGNSKVVSLRPTGDQVEMIVSNGGMTGTFRLTFDKAAPHLIDGIAVEVGDH